MRPPRGVSCSSSHQPLCGRRGRDADAFDRAVGEVAAATRRLLDGLVTTAPPKNREVEAAKARARAEQRYAR